MLNYTNYIYFNLYNEELKDKLLATLSDSIWNKENPNLILYVGNKKVLKQLLNELSKKYRNLDITWFCYRTSIDSCHYIYNYKNSNLQIEDYTHTDIIGRVQFCTKLYKLTGVDELDLEIIDFNLYYSITGNERDNYGFEYLLHNFEHLSDLYFNSDELNKYIPIIHYWYLSSGYDAKILNDEMLYSYFTKLLDYPTLIVECIYNGLFIEQLYDKLDDYPLTKQFINDFILQNIVKESVYKHDIFEKYEYIVRHYLSNSEYIDKIEKELNSVGISILFLCRDEVLTTKQLMVKHLSK